MAAPSLQLSRRVQRHLVGGAIYIMIAAFLAWPMVVDNAVAQPQSNAQQPYECSQPGNSNPQQRRQSLPLTTTSGGTGSGTMYPCLSGVPWTFRLGNPNGSSDQEIIAVAGNVYSPGARTLYWAADGNSSNLYQVAFSGLNLCTGNNTPVSGCRIAVNNVDSNPNNNLDLYASTVGMSGQPRPAEDYTLRFLSDSAITIGGNNVFTDLWATGNSTFSVDLSDIPVGAIGCTIAGGSVAGSNPLFGSDTRVCRNVQVSSLSGLNWLVGGSNYRIIGMDLNFYYLVTHRSNPTDPYTQPPIDGSGNPLSSIHLPNTWVTVE